MTDSIIAAVLTVVVFIGIILVGFSPVVVMAGAITLHQGIALALTGCLFIASAIQLGS